VKTAKTAGRTLRLAALFKVLRRGWKPVPFVLLLWLTPTELFAQPYSIDWRKIAGGGGTSRGGQYSLSGTVGQHDAGNPSSGGNYSLTGVLGWSGANARRAA